MSNFFPPSQGPYTMQADPRTAQILQQEQLRQGYAQGYAQQLAAAQNDPNFALGNPHDRMLAEQQITDDVYNRLGAQGAGGSGTARALASQALVNYRLGLVSQQQAAMANLRQSLGQMTAQPGVPLQGTPVSGNYPYFNMLSGIAASQYSRPGTGSSGFNMPSWFGGSTSGPYGNYPGGFTVGSSPGYSGELTSSYPDMSMSGI